MTLVDTDFGPLHTDKPALVLLSGGLDSAATLGIAICFHPAVIAVSFSYGQTHKAELDAAERQVQRQSAAHPEVTLSHVRLDLPRAPFRGSSLTGDGAIPSEEGVGIPSTYVPARNTVFLSIALGMAETAGAQTIYLGANVVDYSGYPDCRPAYLAAFERMANLATKAGVEASERGEGPHVRIVAPLLTRSKDEIIDLALGYGVPVEETISCYQALSPRDVCATCDACRIRARAFGLLKMVDPATLWRRPLPSRSVPEWPDRC